MSGRWPAQPTGGCGAAARAAGLLIEVPRAHEAVAPRTARRVHFLKGCPMVDRSESQPYATREIYTMCWSYKVTD
jgi:hypothetical protein